MNVPISRNMRILAVAAIVIVVVLAATYLVYNDSDDGPKGFVIIHTNDTHCYYGDDGSLGFSTVKALVEEKEAEGNTVFVIDAGDFLQGTVYGTLSKGGYSVEVMNTVGYDLGIPGNHEFDYSIDNLITMSDSLDYPIICSNLVYKDTGKSVFPEYMVLEKDGVRLGCFGLLTQETERGVKIGNMGNSTVTDAVEAARLMVQRLQNLDVDYIVAVGHIGLDQGSIVRSDEICSRVPGIDIFIDAHSHTEMEDGKVCDGSIELLPSDTVIASTGCHNDHVGMITVTGDGTISAKLYRGEAIPEESVDSVVMRIHDEVESMLAQTIGTTEVYLDGERGHIRNKETNLGDLVADSYRVMYGSDIAVVNAGSIRASVDVGDVTMRDALDACPYVNDIWMVHVTGQQLKDAMELSISRMGQGVGGFLQISGMKVVYDPSAEAGKKVVSIEIDGEVIGDMDRFTMATPEHIGLGGAGYEMFIGDKHEVVGSTPEVLMDYIKGIGTITESTIQFGRLIAIG